MSKNSFIKPPQLMVEYTPEMVLELKRCAEDPVYFISSYCFVQHQTLGRVKFQLRDYQVRIVNTVQESRFTILLIGRQAGKSETVSAIALWFACFNSDKNVLVASNKQKGATDIMNRIRFMYENLPDFLRPGVNFYNRGSIEFDNGSKIFSEATTETTGRGRSVALFICDELAFVPRRVQEEMWASILPTLSTGGKCVVMSTPNGDQDLFAELWRGANSGTNGFTPVYVDISEIPGRDEAWQKEMEAKVGPLKFRQEYLAEFLSSDSLLINSMVLQRLKPAPPLFTNNGFKFWKRINPACSYYVGVDISSGIGSDFSTIQVIEFPTLEQVAEFRSNEISINAFYLKTRWILSYLSDPLNAEVADDVSIDIRKNDRLLAEHRARFERGGRENRARPEVYWSFENNGLGHAFIALIQNDENFPEDVNTVTTPGQILGVHTSAKSKLMAGLELKRLVEKPTGGLQLRSRELLFELNNLISNNKGTFHAKPGCTDDLVSALLVIMQLFKLTADHTEELYNMMYDYTDDLSNAFGEEVEYEPPVVLI